VISIPTSPESSPPHSASLFPNGPVAFDSLDLGKMLPQTSKATYNWLCTGHDTFTAMVEANREATEYVSLETYIYAPGALGETS
jgi:hypothetical protein